jgi:hypothetical protein
MRLALLIGHKPKRGHQGPVVYLSTGNWRIIPEKVNDTRFKVIHNSSPGITLEKQFIIGPCSARIEILEPGTESYISVYAEFVACQ